MAKAKEIPISNSLRQGMNCLDGHGCLDSGSGVVDEAGQRQSVDRCVCRAKRTEPLWLQALTGAVRRATRHHADTTCQTVSPTCLHADPPDRREAGRVFDPRAQKAHNQRSGIMFKIIGAAVVYGFALFGLATYLKDKADEEEAAAGSTGGSRPLRAVRS
jgi:hypothetical protein